MDSSEAWFGLSPPSLETGVPGRRSPGQKARQHRGAVSGQLTLHARVAEAPCSRCLPPSGCRARQAPAPCLHLGPLIQKALQSLLCGALLGGVRWKASCTSRRRTSLTHRVVTPHRGCASVFETRAPRGVSRHVRAIIMRFGTGALGRGGHPRLAVHRPSVRRPVARAHGWLLSTSSGNFPNFLKISTPWKS